MKVLDIETSILSTFLHHEVYSLHFNMTQECVGVS